MLQGSPSALEVKNQLDVGFKHPDIHGCINFHDLEGPVHGVQDPKEEWIWAGMLKFIEAQEIYPPVLCGLVRRITPPPPGGSISSTTKPS